MINNLKKFQSFIKEQNSILLNEQRDYYLEPARQLLQEYPEISAEIFDDKSAIMAVVEQQIKSTNHSIRQIYLDLLAMELAMITPKEVINYQNVNGDCVIHITTQMMCYPSSNLDMFRENGANFSLINKFGETPLIKIAEGFSLDDLKFIHGYTSPKVLNHRDLINGDSALMKAVKARKLLNINFLLEQGASLNIRNNNGLTIEEYIYSEDYKIKSERAFYKELINIIKKYKEN